MGALETLRKWLAPILDPFGELSQHFQSIQQNHLDSLNTLQNSTTALSLAPLGQAFAGPAADKMFQDIDTFLKAERQVSAPSGVLDEVTSATQICVADVDLATETLATKVADDAFITGATEAIDAGAALELGANPIMDALGAIGTTVITILYFAAWVAFGWATYEATQALLNALSQAGSQPYPKLPKLGTTPANSITPAQQKQARQLAEEYNVDEKLITDLMEHGYTVDQIRQILEHGYTVDQIRQILASGSHALLQYMLANQLTPERVKQLLKVVTLAQRVMANAQKGKIRRASKEHGKLPTELEQEILSNPDEVYLTTGRNPKFYFRKGDNVVIVTASSDSGGGNMITSYGPAGERGDSGVSIYGGNPTDPGLPVTDEMIRDGKVPIAGGHGETFPPAIPILP